jgi:protein-disulfide isomerase
MHRRAFLASGLAVALAGCAGGDGTGDGTNTTPGDGETLETHPASQDLGAQPTLGPAPGEATGTIVAFEDPSCRTCARFEREVVPDLLAQYVEQGTVSLVFRGYPVIYPWGEQGTRALEAVYARDPAAHWTLASHYFENQGDFRGQDPATVYDRTESFLASATDLDAAATIDAARNGDADGAVGTDLDAGEAAGAGQTTPHLFMFRDGEFREKSAGVTGLATIEGILEL